MIRSEEKVYGPVFGCKCACTRNGMLWCITGCESEALGTPLSMRLLIAWLLLAKDGGRELL